MKAYLDLLRTVLTEGRHRGDRTGTGTTSIFDYKFVHDMRTGYPLVTTKKVFARGMFKELRAILRGEPHLESLIDEGVKIWCPWRIPEDVIGKRPLANYERVNWMRDNAPELLEKWDKLRVQVKPEAQGHEWLDHQGVPRSVDQVIAKKGHLNAPYGPGWRAFKTAEGPVDQFAYAMDLLRNNPESRRILVSAWNPGWMPEETRQVELSFTERYALFEKMYPEKHGHCEELLSYPEYAGDIDVAIHEMNEAKVPTHKTVKVEPQENVINGKPCLTPCFSPDTLVLTDNGYRPISEIEEGDTVVSGSGNLRKVEKVWVSEHEGKMHLIKVAYQKPMINCTPNHPFLVRDKGWVDAERLEVGDMVAILKPKTDGVPYTHHFTIGHGTNLVSKSHTLTENDYYVLGYFIGNGWASVNTDRVSFAIPDSKRDEILPRIRDTIKVILKPGEAMNVATYQTTSKKWIDLFRQFGHGAHNKRIPEWLMASPDEYRQAFLKGYFDADGCVGKHEATVYSTVSPSLAYGIQRLYSLSGIVARVYYQPRPSTTIIEGRTVNQRDTYLVEIPKYRNHKETINDTEYLWVPVELNLFTDDKLTVYNLAVEEDHTYVVQNIVVHNCHWAFEFYVEDLTVNERLDWLMHHNAEARATFQKRLDSGELCYEEYIHAALDTVGGMFDQVGVPRQYLSLKWHQRSTDVFLGLPFNIASYAMLLEMVSAQLGMIPYKLIGDLSNLHVYDNHLEQVKLQLSREPKPLPRLRFKRVPERIEDFDWQDIEIIGYTSHEAIKGDIAV